MNTLRSTLWMLIGAFMPGIAFAYIDPGTGSILIQGLIAAIAAIGVTLKLYWHRFIGFFRKNDSGTGNSANLAEDTESDSKSP